MTWLVIINLKMAEMASEILICHNRWINISLHFTIYEKESGKGPRKAFVFLFLSLFGEKDM